MILDVREPDEHEQGAIPGALHIARGHLESSIESRVPDKATPIIIHCAVGRPLGVRRQDARRARLHRRRVDGRRVQQVEGRGPRWAAPAQPHRRAAQPLPAPPAPARGRRRPASRSCSTPGCCSSAPAASAHRPRSTSPPRAWARIGIIDMDVVDESNLQRQILHNIERVGDRKVDSAKKTLTLLNPDVDVVTYDVRLGADNVMDILPGWDVIVDGTDNFPTRFLVNDASVKLGIPVVHGSIFRFEGMVTVFDPHERAHLPRHGARAPAGRARAELRRGRRARRAARHRRVDPGASRRSSSSSASATRSSAGCSPTTASSRRSASTRCGAIPATRSPTRTVTASWSPSSTSCACRTRSPRRAEDQPDPTAEPVKVV